MILRVFKYNELVKNYMSNDELVERLIRNGALKTKKIIEAFRKVKRENFVPKKYKNLAYVDQPLPTYEGQTISQPTIVAIMTEALQPQKGDKVLEIGTGSGYQAAILAEIVKPGKVYTIERIKKLVEFAKKNLKDYKNVVVIHGDGSQGLKEEAPFDCIIVTAAAPKVPDVLKEQLKIGGRMIIPVGDRCSQNLILLKKKVRGFEEVNMGPVVFVPLIGKYGFK